MRIILVFFILVCTTGIGQSENLKKEDVYYAFGLFVNRITEQNPEKVKESKEEFEQILIKAAELQEDDTLKWINKIYSYLHKNYLKEYQHFSTLSQTLTQHTYDCLSASALMSLTLSYYGIEHSILEQKNHVLIQGKVDQRDYLLEMTYPREGLILNKSEKAEIIGKYSNTANSKVNHSLYLKELAGLQFYNLAVLSYNEGYEYKSAWYIYFGEMLYPCIRMEEIKILISRH